MSMLKHLSGRLKTGAGLKTEIRPLGGSRFEVDPGWTEPSRVHWRWLGALGILLWLGGVMEIRALTVPELRGQRAAGQTLTLIDVRSTSVFQQGHIPGALNIPAALLSEKRLPPLGRVVVYDEGLGQISAKRAAAVLNGKPGIQAEALAGGFAAWETAQGLTTREKGVQPENLPRISYQDLSVAEKEDLVLVDLRLSRPAARRQAEALTVAETAAPMTDLRKEFPLTQITLAPFELSSLKAQAGGGSGTEKLLVLIDDGKSQAAEEMARALRANGRRRVTILAGGEAILARHGQAGLQRMGLGQAPPAQPPSSAQP